MKFRARFIANAIQFAAMQGANPNALTKLTGKALSDLNEDDYFFESDVYNAVVEEAVKQTSDPFLGLHLGEHLSLSAAGLIIQIIQTCNQIKDALHYMVAFANLGCQALPFSLQEHNDHWVLSLTPNPLWEEQSPIAVRHTLDGSVVFTLREFYSLTRYRHHPLRIDFAYARPASIAEYERLFRCPIRFSQAQTAIYLDAKLVEAPIITSDYRLLQILVEYANEKLNRLEKELGFSNTVKQTIIHLVQAKFPTIEQVAANLHMSIRTLQRRLKEEKTSYKSVLDNLKQQFAFDYLKKEDLSIKEIAYLLNYSDASSFTRSFRRWTGQSPEQYRLQQITSNN